MEVKNKYINKVTKLVNGKVRCPTCKTKSNISYNPFCSKKCSDLDLLKWLSDKNSIDLK
jgi:endogenous inhibitor of DNA gyrase (YacG/DUF329 family)